MSSKRADRNPVFPGLWRKLAMLREREVCLADWKRLLGAGFAPLAEFIEIMPGTIAASYPDPGCGLPLKPRRIYDGTFTATLEEDEALSFEPQTGLKDADVVRWRLRWDKIGAALAAAFGIEPREGPGPVASEWVRAIGLMRQPVTVRPVMLMIARDKREALDWVHLLARGEPSLFVLPFHDPVCAELTAIHKQGYAALDRDTGFVKDKGNWRLKAYATPPETAHASAATGKPVARVIGDFTSIELPSGRKMLLGMKHKRRAFLRVVSDWCREHDTDTFFWQQVLEDYNAQFTDPNRKHMMIKTDRIDDDLFKGQRAEFDELFETLDRASGHLRLKVSFTAPSKAR